MSTIFERPRPRCQAGRQLPVISGVSNAASGIATAAPITYLAIYGSNFALPGSATATWSDSVVNGNLPTTFSWSHRDSGRTISLYLHGFAEPDQHPDPERASGPSRCRREYDRRSSSVFTIPSQSASPAFFTWGSFAVATHLDYSLAVKNGIFTGPTVPAKPGEVIILWGTGFGNTSPSAPVGLLTPAQTYGVSGVSASVGGLAATVYATALAPGLAGLYQVAIQVPSDLADGDYPLAASINGLSSSTRLLLTVKS